MKGRTTCYLHGGPSPAGLASPSFKGGRWSKYLPAGMASLYEPNDPAIIELREDLAALDAFGKLLLQRMAAGDAAPARWSDLAAAWASFKGARDRRDTKAMIRAAGKLEDLIATGASFADNQKAYLELLDQRARMAAVESRRLKDQNEMVPRSEFQRFAGALLSAFAAHVPDLPTRAKVQDEFVRIMALSMIPNGQVIDAGGVGGG